MAKMAPSKHISKHIRGERPDSPFASLLRPPDGTACHRCYDSGRITLPRKGQPKYPDGTMGLERVPCPGCRGNDYVGYLMRMDRHREDREEGLRRGTGWMPGPDARR